MTHHAAGRATCLLAVALATGAAAPAHPVALPPSNNGVITPNDGPVDPHMPVVHPKVPERTPVIKPPTQARRGKVVIDPR